MLLGNGFKSFSADVATGFNSFLSSMKMSAKTGKRKIFFLSTKKSSTKLIKNNLIEEIYIFIWNILYFNS